MWADHRAVAEAEEITATRHRALDYVGGVMSPEMQLPKLLWLKRHLPAAWARYGLALDLADFLAWRASGRLAVSACTVTCKWTYLNHEEPGWQRDLLERIGLGDLAERARLPERAVPVGSAAGRLTAEAAAELCLTRGCVVGVGLIDAHAGGLGLLGHLEPAALNERVAVIAGTSTCHMAASEGPRHIPGVWGPYFGAMIPGLWLTEGGQSATGALLDHIVDWHAEGRGLGPARHARVVERALALLEAEGPGFAGELQVLPDFHGNRSPLADPAARGVIHGLSLDSSFDSLARLYYAAALGIALGTRHICDALDAHGYELRFLHLTGGHVANPLLLRLYADATGRTVVLPEEPDSVLLGTAIVAAAAAGLHPSLAEAARSMIGPGREIAPAAGTRAHFDRQYRRFLLMHEHRRALALS
jgi:FGGY-family pentulose kinase